MGENRYTRLKVYLFMSVVFIYFFLNSIRVQFPVSSVDDLGQWEWVRLPCQAVEEKCYKSERSHLRCDGHQEEHLCKNTTYVDYFFAVYE